MRYASDTDVPLLAKWNRQLVEDGQSGNPMSDGELEDRMRAWLSSEYQAVIFEESTEPVSYAVFRPLSNGMYLQQFFVARSHRRKGVGRQSVEIFRREVLREGATVFLDVVPHNQRALDFWSAVGFENYAISFRL
jgi:GNAT superfamily N-acetyltransferase